MKKKQTLPPKYKATGFTDWGIKRTIREAENVARWNPWLARAWMAEALEQLSLEAPYFTEYDSAVTRINAYWTNMARFRWYNPDDFWSLEGEIYEPQYLKYTTELEDNNVF